MKMTKIVQRENEVLRKKAEEVPVSEINSPKIQKVIKRMKEALAGEEDGVAIAAPQIGELLRIFVVSGRAFSIIKRLENSKTVFPDMIFINPIITKLSKEKKEMEEGCLSVRWLYGKVKRAKQATVEAYDETGELFKRGASGLMAQIYQHEIDHLNGILFTDTATDLEDIPPAEEKKDHHPTI